MSIENKRFEDWYDVDCNECSHYWDSSCDGADKDTKRLCNSFTATRSVIIPKQLEGIKKDIKYLYILMAIQVLFDLLVAYNLVVINMGW